MVGARLTFSALAIAPLLASVSAHAADYYQPPPPPPYQPPPIIIQQPAPEFAGNWYLRGQVGAGMMSEYKLEVSPIPAGGSFASKSISDTFFIGAGIGYEWNNWLRFDWTAEYRAKARIYALGYYQPGPPIGTGPVFVDDYQGYLKSWVFLANAYVDLGTWDCFTPFIGAGIGAALNTVSEFSDVSPAVPGGAGSSFGTAHTTSDWNLAWALYAGVTYNVTKTFKIDLTYRYLNLGSAKTTIECNGGCGGTNFTFKNLTSNDFMLAFRWECCDFAPPPPKYVYTPPPYVPPPPLQSKG
jgi:opacity protein-like surface antigen